MGVVCRSGVKGEHRVSLCVVVFSDFICRADVAIQRRNPPRRRQVNGALVSVGVDFSADRGVVDPVEDDEGHASDHDHEAAYEEGGGLEGGEGTRPLVRQRVYPE